MDGVATYLLFAFATVTAVALWLWPEINEVLYLLGELR